MAPPLGPPMWGIQRRYKKQFPDRDAFIERMVSFVQQPTQKKAIHDEALGQLGLMPPMPLPEALLTGIEAIFTKKSFRPPL